MDIKEAKNAARARALQTLRKMAKKPNKFAKDYKICKNLQNLLNLLLCILQKKSQKSRFNQNKRENFGANGFITRFNQNKLKIKYFKNNAKKIKILLFYPLEIEPNIRKILLFCKKSQKYEAFLPFISSENSFKMIKFRLPLQKGVLKISAPKSANIAFYNPHLMPQIAIIPAICVDKNFKRIGFGKGMYDRFFEKSESCVKIFIAQNNIESTALSEPHDICGDYFISPFSCLERKKNVIYSRYELRYHRVFSGRGKLFSR